MFNFLKRNGKQVAELTLKTFEVYAKEIIAGTFIVQERAVCIGTVAARTQEEANIEARRMGGYAVHPLKD